MAHSCPEPLRGMSAAGRTGRAASKEGVRDLTHKRLLATLRMNCVVQRGRVVKKPPPRFDEGGLLFCPN